MGISDGALEVASLGSVSIGTFQRPVQRFMSAHDLLPRLAVPGWRGQTLPENRSDMIKVQPFPIPGGGTPEDTAYQFGHTCLRFRPAPIDRGADLRRSVFRKVGIRR